MLTFNSGRQLHEQGFSIDVRPVVFNPELGNYEYETGYGYGYGPGYNYGGHANLTGPDSYHPYQYSNSSTGYNPPISHYGPPPAPQPKPQYGPPPPQPNPQYGPPLPPQPKPQYGPPPPKPQYGPPTPPQPKPQYGPPPPNYGPPSSQPKPQYGPPTPDYGPPLKPKPQYGPPTPIYGSPPQPNPHYGYPSPRPQPASQYGYPSPPQYSVATSEETELGPSRIQYATPKLDDCSNQPWLITDNPAAQYQANQSSEPRFNYDFYRWLTSTTNGNKWSKEFTQDTEQWNQ